MPNLLKMNESPEKTKKAVIDLFFSSVFTPLIETFKIVLLKFDDFFMLESLKNILFNKLFRIT